MILINIEAGPETPKVKFDLENSFLEIRGRSFPGDPVSFYKPLVQKLGAALSQVNERLSVIIDIDYFDDHSLAYLQKIFGEIRKLKERGVETGGKWYHHNKDEDYAELGKALLETYGLALEVVAKEEDEEGTS